MKRLITLIVGVLCTAPWSVRAQFDDAAAAQLQKLVQAYRYVDAAYVDSLDTAPLVEEAIRGMLTRLDPHSAYLSEEEMKGVDESFDGSFGGIGIEFNVLNDTVVIVNTIAGGPSAQVGLLPGDRIVGIDGQRAVGLSRAEVPERLRGPSGTQVRLEVSRHAVKEPLAFTVTRGDIPLHTVDAAYKVDAETGYIKVNRFGRTTMQEFVEAFKGMKGVRSLILDLRGNGGGLLDQAIDLSNFFLPAGSLIVSTEGLRVPPGEARATTDGPFTTGKVIVLTNETSASGSEIVAGALQDWDRALVLGRRTFGKGLVQRQFPLVDGSAIRLTVARYHTPTGRVIQRPFKNGDLEGYEMDFINRFGKTGDTTRVDSSEMFRTLRSGRTVFGGGGITPDITVEYDTTEYSKYLSNLIRKGMLNEFAVAYMDRNRDRLSKTYPTIEAFSRNFKVDEKVLSELTQMAEQKGVPFDKEGFDRSARQIGTQIKALLAQKLWGFNEYFVIMNAENDEVFAKALEVLKNWNQYGDSTGTVLPQKP